MYHFPYIFFVHKNYRKLFKIIFIYNTVGCLIKTKFPVSWFSHTLRDGIHIQWCAFYNDTTISKVYAKKVGMYFFLLVCLIYFESIKSTASVVKKIIQSFFLNFAALAECLYKMHVTVPRFHTIPPKRENNLQSWIWAKSRKGIFLKDVFWLSNLLYMYIFCFLLFLSE